MKIIDLLNKIANGEEVPKKIKYKDWLYNWNESAKDYECGNDWLEERICDDFKTFLNDEVEIIEEDKKTEKLPYYDYSKIMNSNDKFKTMELMIEKHEKRINDSWGEINQIIDYINNKD